MNRYKQKFKDNFTRIKKQQTQDSPVVKCQELSEEGEWKRVIKEAIPF